MSHPVPTGAVDKVTALNRANVQAKAFDDSRSGHLVFVNKAAMLTQSTFVVPFGFKAIGQTGSATPLELRERVNNISELTNEPLGALTNYRVGDLVKVAGMANTTFNGDRVVVGVRSPQNGIYVLDVGVDVASGAAGAATITRFARNPIASTFLELPVAWPLIAYDVPSSLTLAIASSSRQGFSLVSARAFSTSERQKRGAIVQMFPDFLDETINQTSVEGDVYVAGF